MQATGFGYLLWFVVVFGSGIQIYVKSRAAAPEIRSRAFRVTALERAVVAVRKTLGKGPVAPRELGELLLAHGIEAQPLPGSEGKFRFTIRLGPEAHGELEIRRGAGGRRLVEARGGKGRARVAIRALVTPPGEM